MKKKLYISIIILVSILVIVYKWCLLPVFLVLQGYVPNNYAVYKKLDDTYETQVLKVYKKNRDFKYVEVSKNQFGLWELKDEGELCTAEDLYTSFGYEVFVIENQNESFSTDAEWHKVFEIKKTVKDINFTFENLPTEVSHEFMEMDDGYIVELISRQVNVGRIDLETFVDKIEN